MGLEKNKRAMLLNQTAQRGEWLNSWISQKSP